MPEDNKKGGMALMIAMGKPKGEAPKEEIVEENESPDEAALDIHEEEETKESPYCIELPEGYEPPNGEEGKPFDEVVKAVIKNGKIYILKVGSVETGEKVPEEGLEETDGAYNEEEESPMETMKVEPNAEKAFGMALKTQRGGQ